MRILVNDLAASRTGALAVLKSFYDYVCENDTENEWIFLISGEYLEPKDNIKVATYPGVKKSWMHKLWFDLFSGRKVINKYSPDYVLSLQNIITRGVKCRSGVYIHQAIPFQSEKKFSFFKRDEMIFAVYQHLIGSFIKSSARRADDVFVQTDWMKEAVAERSRVNADKISVVRMSAVEFERSRSPRTSYNGFFYPAGFPAVYKNHDCIYKACSYLDRDGCEYKVLLTLDKGPEPVSNRVEFIGAQNKSQMQKNYEENALVFPSYIETVGLPLIEARSVGTVILASDCAFSKEVLAGYENAYFFDPFRPESLAELMRRVITGEIKPKEIKDDFRRTDGWGVLTDRILYHDSM